MKRVIFRITVIILIITLSLSAFLGVTVLYAKKNIDYSFDEELFKKAKEDQTVYYYASGRDGGLEEVYKSVRNSMREWTDFSDIGEYLKLGFIAMEDRDFYSHKGVNLKRTIAAVANYLFKLGGSFGASTITQQVIKNISGDNETSISRKVKEILRAVNLERNHSKDDIFELYLNVIPMSGNIYGVGAASAMYFNKEPSELTLAEAATIVGITNAPTRYNPYLNPDACKEKRDRVLYAMLDVGAISREEYQLAVESPIQISNESSDFGVASWFVETANEEILKDICTKYSITPAVARLMMNGARVILTMNRDIQDIMEDYFENTDNLSEKFSKGLNYSMVISDPYTGDLLGIIGNGGRKKGERLFNYATSPITPGSVIKPIALYAPLIEDGTISWSTMFEDAPSEYIDSNGEQIPYPRNSPDIYEGMIDIRDAISKSKNTVAVRLFDILGPERIFSHLTENYGFDTLVKSYTTASGTVVSDMNKAPLALGQLSYGVSLRKLTEAYNAFPNNGVLCGGRSYTAVYDRDGALIVGKEVVNKRIYSIETAQIMNQLLSEVVLDGTARQIRLKENVDTAGKTGTSGNDKDRLFVGYTPYFTAGIWCGFGKSDLQVGHNVPNHLQIWDEVMKRIHDRLIFSDFEEAIDSFDTSRITIAPYCSKSGNVPTEWCELDDESMIKFGYFSDKNTPLKECEYH
jgi:penicillin-binding protein 1A